MDRVAPGAVTTIELSSLRSHYTVTGTSVISTYTNSSEFTVLVTSSLHVYASYIYIVNVLNVIIFVTLRWCRLLQLLGREL